MPIVETIQLSPPEPDSMDAPTLVTDVLSPDTIYVSSQSGVVQLSFSAWAKALVDGGDAKIQIQQLISGSK